MTTSSKPPASTSSPPSSGSGPRSMSSLRISGPPAIILGTMNFGQRTNDADSEAIIRRALERGITAFDTANIYCEGASERILGRALGADRKNVTIATKVGAWKREGLSAARVKASIHESLQRLGTSYVDVYYLHVPDRKTPIAGTLGGMTEVITSGAARGWGISNYASWQILEMLQLASSMGLARPVMAQQLYNMVHRELDIEYFAFRKAYPIHLTVYNALAGGLLTGRHVQTEEARGPEKGSRLDTNNLYRRRYANDAMFDRGADVVALAQHFSLSPVQLAYAFLASRPEIDSVLVGPATIEQLDAAIDGINTTLHAECLEAIETLHRTWMGTDTHYAR